MTASATPPLCASCQSERSRWLDYRLPRAVNFSYGSGAPHDVSTAGVRDRIRASGAQWRAIIRFQRDLIARTCREQGHTAASAPALRFINVPLFDLIAGAA